MSITLLFAIVTVISLICSAVGILNFLKYGDNFGNLIVLGVCAIAFILFAYVILFYRVRPLMKVISEEVVREVNQDYTLYEKVAFVDDIDKDDKNGKHIPISVYETAYSDKIEKPCIVKRIYLFGFLTDKREILLIPSSKTETAE